MVRFSAPERDIEQMLRFLSRRMPAGVRMVPLQAGHRDALRWRRTVRPLIDSLRSEDGPISWGMRTAPASGDPAHRLTVREDEQTETLHVDPDASHLIGLNFGPAEGAERRRDALILVRDWDLEGGHSAEPDVVREADAARNLVERTARHLRRGAVRNDGRWILGENESASEAVEE
jgi:hypothetical protein